MNAPAFFSPSARWGVMTVLLVLAAGRVEAAPVQRFLLVIGANSAGADRPKLQYAVSDAERFARVLVDLGGVARANEIVLRQPTLQELIAALDQLHARVGGHVGAGVDFHVARWLSVGVSGGYNWMLDFAEPIGRRDNYSGPQLDVNIGWLFGRSH